MSNKQFLKIAIEGIDGTGKTTIANKLKDKLISAKIGYVNVYHPINDSGLSNVGDELNITKGNNPYAHAAINIANMYEMDSKSLKNEICIYDRGLPSALVYPIALKNAEIHTLFCLVSRMGNGSDINPTVTFYLNGDIKNVIKRLKNRDGDVHDDSVLNLFKLHVTYEGLFKHQTEINNNVLIGDVVPIDCDKPIDDVVNEMYQIVMKYYVNENYGKRKRNESSSL